MWMPLGLALLICLNCQTARIAATKVSSSVVYSTTPTGLTIATLNRSSQKNFHLIVMVHEYPLALKKVRNSTGHLIGLEGVAPLILDWLSRRFKFDYSVLDANVSVIDNKGPKLPGLVTYALRGECEMIIGQIVQSIVRLPYFEIIHAWIYSEPAFLLPMSQVSQNNVEAIIKPFQSWVWVALAAASVSFIVTLLVFQRHSTAEMKPLVKFKESLYMYVLGTLLNQGGYISCKMTPIRLVVGAWCLLTFVLVNVYNGVLISYVTATLDAPPLINSLDDVLAKTDLRLVVDRGQAIDIVFTTSEKGLYKALGDKLRSYPKSRCNTTQECVNLVKSLSPQHVYFNTAKAIKDAMKEDYQLTHKCSMTISADKGTSDVPAGFVLRKTSPYLEMFNRGTLMLLETGLTLKWESEFEADTKPCHSNSNSVNRAFDNPNNRKAPLVRLSLANLAGAFVVLAIGCLISFLAFLTEMLSHYMFHQT